MNQEGIKKRDVRTFLDMEFTLTLDIYIYTAWITTK